MHIDDCNEKALEGILGQEHPIETVPNVWYLMYLKEYKKITELMPTVGRRSQFSWFYCALGIHSVSNGERL
jgi:hypothetical protein